MNNIEARVKSLDAEIRKLYDLIFEMHSDITELKLKVHFVELQLKEQDEETR